MAGADASYGFIVEWFDSQAELTRRYKMSYYVRKNNPEGNEVDLFDLKNKRTFLKRVASPTIQIEDLFIGSKVTIYSRQMTIVEFADPITSAKFAKKAGFLALLPTGGADVGNVLRRIESADFKLHNLKRLTFSAGEVSKFMEMYFGTQKEQLFSWVCKPNQTLLAVELVGGGGIAGWEKLGVPGFVDGSPQAVANVFGDGCMGTSSAQLERCTCCVVKPHAFKAGVLGRVVCDILAAGFAITAVQTFSLDREATEEFLEVYKGVAPGYTKMVNEMCAGPMVGLCINGGGDVVQKFRQTAGPFQFDFAQQLRPDTLRAKYGKDSDRNAIHCTDLPEDGELDCEYLFSLQQ